MLLSIYILLIIWLDLCLSQLAPTSFKNNPRKWGFHCPNDCRKRGICTAGDLCLCQQNWYGPDCSIARCPYDYSYNSKPIEFNVAHSMTECSNQGLCDINTGKCNCFRGFEGQACQRQSCSDNSGLICSGHGTCMAIDDIYKYFTIKDSSSPSAYTSWDAGHTTSCVCDEGYTGPLCEITMCPKGDDPLTPKTGYKVYTITTSTTSGTLRGNFLLHFNKYSVSIPARASLWSASACVTALQSIPVLGTVLCTQSAINAGGGATYTVTIKSYPLYPKDNNIFPLDGTVNTGVWGCDVSMASRNSECVITDVTPINTLLPEYVMCSNRGHCDISGNCVCASPLFYGPNCGAYRVIDIKTTVPNPVDILGIEINNATYSHTILGLYGVIGGNEPQNNGPGILPWLFNTTSMRVLDYSDNAPSDKNKFSIDSDGNIKSVGGLNMLGNGITVRANGLISKSGMTVNGILTVNTKSNEYDVYPARFLDPNNKVEITGGLSITSSQDTNITNGLRVYNGGINIGLGGIANGSRWDKAFINDNGIKINAGGVTVSAGGLFVTAGITVSAGGLTGSVRSTIVIRDLSLNVLNGGMTIQGVQLRAAGRNGSVTGYSGGLVMSSLQTTYIYKGGFSINGTLTVANSGLQVTGGISVLSRGVNVVTKGLTVFNSGLVAHGGVTVATGNVIVSGRLTLTTGYNSSQSIRITGGVTIYTDGLKITTKGLTVSEQGLYITTKGFTVNDEGIYITAKGLTVNKDGLLVTNGMTVGIGGLYVTLGMTIASEGLYITAKGLSVAASGNNLNGTAQMNLVDGATVASGGLNVNGGLTVYDTGLYVTTKGLTVSNQGLYITLKGFTIQNSGLSVSAGDLKVSDSLLITAPSPSPPNEIKNNGLTLNDGLSIENTGLYVSSKGLTITNGGLNVTAGGFEVKDLGLTVRGGLTISDIGMTVTVKGLTVYDSGLLVATKGLTVKNLGIRVKQNLYVNTTYNSSGLGFEILTRGLKVTSNTDSNQVTGGMRVISTTIALDGIKVTGGLTISNSGLFLLTQGLSINSLGLQVRGGLIVQNGNANITGSATVKTLRVTGGGMTVLSGGFSILTKGMTVQSDGLIFGADSSGLTIKNSGLFVSDEGLTVNNHGLDITGQLQLKNSDLLTDKLTIVANGFKVGSRLTVSGGLNADSMEVKNSGLVVTTKGLTVLSLGLVITTKGLTIRREGLVITGNTIVTSGSLQINDGISIQNNGLVYSNTSGGSLSVDRANVTGTISVFSNGLKVTHKSGNNKVYDNGLKILQGGLIVYGIVTGFCLGCSDYRTAGAITSPWSNNPLMPGTKNTTALPAFSDKSIKTNFAKINDSIGIVRKLRGFSYNWIDDPPDDFQFDKKKHLGLMAQDVQDVLPDLVTSRNNTYLEVNYMEIIPLLIDAISKLKIRLEEGNSDCTSEYSNKLIDDIYSLREKISSLEIEYDSFRKEVERLRF